jgi:hypothetical protein
MSSDDQGRIPNSSEARGSSARLIPDKGADSSTLLIREQAFDPLWTPEQVAQRLNVFARLGAGSLVPEGTKTARDPSRWRPRQGRTPALSR